MPVILFQETMASAALRFVLPDRDLPRLPRASEGKRESYNNGEFVTHDRRRLPRYKFDTSIGVDDGIGRALDMSGIGMRFESARALEPGDSVALVFPLEHAGPGASVTCNAHVVRVESRGALFVVAVTYEPVAFSVAT